MLFKLSLWASLTFFKDDPQIKIAVAQFICFLQVALHARLDPFSSTFKNTMQAFGICLAFAVSFGGLVINYLKESQKNAHLLRNKEEADALKGKLDGFKSFLEIVVYVSIAGYSVLAVWRVTEIARANRDRLGRLARRFSSCARCRGRQTSEDGEGGGEASAAVEMAPRPASERLDIDFESKATNSINPIFERSVSKRDVQDKGADGGRYSVEIS